MRNTHYRQTLIGKLTTTDALQVIDDLEAGGESATYMELMVTELVTLMKRKGADNFEIESAKELIFVMIATERFIPEVFQPENRVSGYYRSTENDRPYS